ncbi:poly(hydroxyalkanoate) depolymerase family esterase [Micromonospora vinacea]|uniref:Poly(Hydroxyalkanoate) depolymerase family esterase n=1 Tax=Micromonospora vinacea TaxID=709878 RepID=A0ABS0KAN6_9ACTN|nr:PHB depolymerase family esterase [Micromonospora vinacea]MBG6105708.1 poly(hydroxyalkanoate) depolymerase family esterase [Micromonospora vinacea]WTA65443.1 PHB depolymerase family esterase [Micromonospora sp. NBC_00855]
MSSPAPVSPAGSKPTRRVRRRWLRIVSGVLVAVVAAVSVGVAALQLGLPWQMGEGDRNHVYDGDAGSQRYQVHLPPQHDGTARLPVVMAIHGCAMTGYGWNSMKSTTQFNRLADREGFIVVYPTQLISRNVIACWNSTDPREQHRDSGEPALLAGVARQVVEKYGADPDRVHVAGASSGAGTAVILAVTYPDVFATATSVAGGEYGLDQVDPNNPDSTSPLDTARQAWAQMGERARRVPLLVIQGEQDEVVPPLVATRLVAHWTAVGDLVDDGLPNNSLDLTEETVSVPAEAGRHAYTHSTITAPDGSSIVESYRVQDMGHAWPGPDGDGRYTDHAGPDASEIVWRFAERHPMR